MARGCCHKFILGFSTLPSVSAFLYSYVFPSRSISCKMWSPQLQLEVSGVLLASPSTQSGLGHSPDHKHILGVSCKYHYVSDEQYPKTGANAVISKYVLNVTVYSLSNATRYFRIIF